MSSGESKEFVRVNYDDRRTRPWIVIWGQDHDAGSFRTREEADYVAVELRGMCDVFHEWMAGRSAKK